MCAFIHVCVCVIRYVAVRIECPRLRDLHLRHDNREVDDPEVAFSFGALRFRDVIRRVDVDWSFPFPSDSGNIDDDSSDDDDDDDDDDDSGGGGGSGTNPVGEDDVGASDDAKHAWPELRRLRATTISQAPDLPAPLMPKLVALELDLAHRHDYCSTPFRVLTEEALSTLHRPSKGHKSVGQRSRHTGGSGSGGGGDGDGGDGSGSNGPYCCPRLQRLAVAVTKSGRLSGEDGALGGYEHLDPLAALHSPTSRWGAWSWLGSLARYLPPTLATVDLSTSQWPPPVSPLAVERAEALKRHIRSLLPSHVRTLLPPWHRRRPRWRRQPGTDIAAAAIVSVDTQRRR